MIIPMLKALTWGTIAAAVFSAVLMALTDGATPRMASLTSAPLRAAPTTPEPAATGVAPARAERDATNARATHPLDAARR